MPGVRLTPEQAAAANSLLVYVRIQLKQISNGNEQLHFSPRRRIYVRLSYDERGTPAQRTKLKKEKWQEQNGKCAIGGEDLQVSESELDRLDPVAGYTPENTQLVCHAHHRAQQKQRGFS